MTWEPYTPEILSYLPDACRSDQREWRVIAPLIFMDIVEWHHPDRVMRQFGFKQCVPSACDTSTKLHKIDRRGKLQFDYKQLHKVYLDLWETRLSRVVEGEPLHGPMQYNDPYMVWYRQITRLFVSPIRQSSVRYQPRSLHFHMLTQGLATIHARCQEKLALTDVECPAFREFIGDMSNFVAQTLDIVGQSYLIQDPATHFPSVKLDGYPSDQHPPPGPPQSPSTSNGDPSDQHALSPLPPQSPPSSNGYPSDQHTLSPLPPQSPPSSNGYPSDQHALSSLPPQSPPPSCSPRSSSQPQPTISPPLATPPPPLPPTSSGSPSIPQPTDTPTFLPPLPEGQPQPTASSLPPNHIHIHLVLPPYHSMPSLYSTPTAYMSNSHTPAYHPSSHPTPTPYMSNSHTPAYHPSSHPTPTLTSNPATYMATSFTIPPSAYHLTSTPPVFPPQPHAPPTPSACPTTSPSQSQHAPPPPHPTYTPVLQSTPLSAPSTQRSMDSCTSNQFIAPHSSPYLSQPCFTPSTDNTIEKSKTNAVRGSGKPPKAKKRHV